MSGSQNYAPIVIGVDNGNANTKTVHSIFTSGLTEHDIKPPVADECIEYNGKFYTLSSKRLIYTRDKTKSIDCFILTLFAIAKEILASGRYQSVLDICLAVDLPPEHYSLQKDKFANYFKSFGNTIIFKYNDKPFTINLYDDVYVFPQGFAAVSTKASELKEYTRVYIVDIGGYTTDILLINKGKPDLQYCRSLEDGIITMNNKIQGRISTTYDQKIDDEHIYDVLFNRKTVLSKEIQEQIRKESGLHAINILNQCRELGVDLKSDPAFFVGGGALLLKPFIESSGMVSVTEFLEDISANAYGCTILGNAKLMRNLQN
jgi:plasmid segregation protein ParM